jgi:acyl dehydratase
VLDSSFVGRVYPPTEPHLVDRVQISAFAAAIGADDPAHHDCAAAQALGFADVVAPPTFPIVLTLGAARHIAEDPTLGLNWSRVVHGDQRFAYTRPVVAGDRLRCVCTVEAAVSRAGSDLLTIRTDVVDTEDLPVCSTWTLLVSRAAS